jgi:Fe2+ transport system protein FeoA
MQISLWNEAGPAGGPPTGGALRMRNRGRTHDEAADAAASRKSDAAVPLSSLADGATGRVSHVDAAAGLRARLLAMGLRRGAEVRVVKNGGAGPFVLALQAARLVLGRGMSQRVYVSPLKGRGEG